MITNMVTDRDLYKRGFFTLCLAAFVLLFAENVLATTSYSNTNDVIGNTLCRLTQNLTGNTAKAIGTLAIFATGISLFMGKVQWTTAAMIAVGVGVLFSANSLVGFLSGSAASCA